MRLRGGHTKPAQALSEYQRYLEDFFSAVRAGQCRKVRFFLTAGVDINLRDKNGGRTALIWAGKKGHSEVVQVLTKARANLDLQDSQGETALTRAAYGGYTRTVQSLTKARANLDLQNRKGATALMGAADKGRTRTVQVLAKARADLDLKTKDHQTALMWAAYGGHTRTVQTLINAKANLNLQTVEARFSALMWAVNKEHPESMKLLLHSGANASLTAHNGKTAEQFTYSKKITRAFKEYLLEINTLLPTALVEIVADYDEIK